MNTRCGTGNPPPATTPPEWSGQSATGWSPRGRQIGPCFRCAGWGHLQSNCPKMPKMYSFDYDAQCYCCNVSGGSDVVNMRGEHPQGMAPQVDDCTAVGHASESGELEFESLSCRTWEVEQGASPIPGGQVMDVQGRLKRCLRYWSATLEAPGPQVWIWLQIAIDVCPSCLHAA